MTGQMVCKILNDNGYQAYMVGGYPRDLYRHVKNNDIDICTDAKPEEVVECFSKVDKVLKQFGTVIIDNIQITTFRKEISYQGHYPKVEFVTDLKEDLKRRDFTINTLCLDKDNNYIDYYNARKDIDDKIIKSVGDPLKKIKEDPLRMLRAIRFSVCLNFNIDDALKKAIKESVYLLDLIPIGKIKYEKDIILKYIDNDKFHQICKYWNLERWEEVC